jgi:hypothetical protein
MGLIGELLDGYCKRLDRQHKETMDLLERLDRSSEEREKILRDMDMKAAEREREANLQREKEQAIDERRRRGLL